MKIYPTFTVEQRKKICAKCGYSIGLIGCSYECDLDGKDPREPGDIIERVYEVTYKLVDATEGREGRQR